MVEQLKGRWPLLLFGLLACGALALAFPHAISALYLEAGGRAMDDPAQAVARLQQALEWDGANAQAYRLLGRAYLALGQNEAALDALSQASTLRPKNPLLHMELAQAYEAWGRAPGEDADLDRQAAREWKLAGLNVDKLLDQGEKYRKEGFPDEALVWYERAMRLAPDLGDPWYYVGRMREDQHDWDGALAAYERAREMGTLQRVGMSTIWFRIGQIFQLQVDPPRYQDAQRAYEEGLASGDSTASTMAWLHARRAQIYLVLGGDKGIVEAELKTALELHPQDPWLHVIAGDFYLQVKREDLAQAEYLSALEIAPGFEAAQIRLERLKAKP